MVKRPEKFTEDNFLDIANPNRQATIGEFTYIKNGMSYLKKMMIGYNRAIDAYEKFLPDEEEIKNLVSDNAPCYMQDYVKGSPLHEKGVNLITQALLKRLR